MDELVKELFELLKAERAENVRLVNILLNQETMPTVNVIPPAQTLQSVPGKKHWTDIKKDLEMRHKITKLEPEVLDYEPNQNNENIQATS